MKSKLFTLATSLALVTGLQATPRPNIILAMADDMGWGDVSYNSMTVTLADDSPHPDQGWIQTPVMDEMASNGLQFNRFYSASAVCSPTRASCLTGRNPYRVGVPFANLGRLGFDETPLSEILAAQGYRCGHFGKWHLGSMTTLRSDSNRGGNASVYSAPWHHSYDFCFATESKTPTYHPYRRASNSAALPTSFSDPNFYGTHYWRFPETFNQVSGEGIPVPVEEVNNLIDGDDSKLIVDQAISYIEDAVADDEPFFIVLWFHTPHKPVTDPEGTSGVDSSNALKDSIEDLDLAIGNLRTRLTELGVRDNTMFWLTSDNGPEDGINSPNESSTVRSIRSGRLFERKRSLHEGGLRVPGILEWPAMIPTGRVTEFPSVTSDYYPTILDYLCLSVPNQKPLDGVSLRPVIEGGTPSRTKPIGFKINDDNSWVGDQYKIIEDNGTWELFDLLADPTESSPVANANNIGSQPAAIQDIYNTMLADFTAWNATLTSDVPYIHSSQPTVSLGTPASEVSASFTVTATFSEVVTQLEENEIVVNNGSVSSLSGSGTTWSFLVTPVTNGLVNINLPEGAAIDADGNTNASSNLLSVTQGNLSAPDVNLTTPADPVDSAFVVTATFTEDVTGLAATDFEIVNGSVTNLAGGPSVYTATITPGAPGTVSASLPGNVAEDSENDGNNASNIISVLFAPPSNPFPLIEFQTVDSDGFFPASGSNNIDKFDVAGTSSGTVAPFDTLAYARSSGTAARSAQLFLQFSLDGLDANAVASATLDFNAYSLNDLLANDTTLFVSQITNDWSPAGNAGALNPDYDPAITGPPVNGGSVTSGTGGDLYTGGGFNPGTYRNSTAYSVDVTGIVQNWQEGEPNHGFHLELGDSTTINQGLGIDPASLILNIATIPSASVFADWISGFGLAAGEQGIDDDPDDDQIANGIEAWLGTDPGQANEIVTSLTSDGIVTNFQHPQNETPPSDLSGSYEWSTDLTNWYPADGITGPVDGSTVSISPLTSANSTMATATASGEMTKLFIRITMSQN
ncbi:MAG: sulfatase-like hydrolase/transferase [Akkermansiaceae bacterium]